MKLRTWGAFILLGVIWGSSFLWIRIAVRDTGPFTLVAFRVLFGLLGLIAVMIFTKQAFPRNGRTVLRLAILGLVNSALPFTLISWGETRIGSGLASILCGSVPLFTILVAHYWLDDEHLTTPRVAGLLIGFAGLVMLVGGDLTLASLNGNLPGELAVIAAALSYAVGSTFSRKHLRGESPVVISAGSLLTADLFMWLMVPVVGAASPGLNAPAHFPTMPITWFALIWLGVLGSCIAYVLFFHLLNVWGAGRTSLVTYVSPVVGLILGIVFLHETFDWRLAGGSALVASGILVANLAPRSAIAGVRARKGAPGEQLAAVSTHREAT